MRAVIEIFLAIIFSVFIGTTGLSLISSTIKKESILKIQNGLGSLESFTKQLNKE